MLALSAWPRVDPARGPTDLRKSIDAVAAIVQQHFRVDPFSPALFVFCNWQRNKLKTLYRFVSFAGCWTDWS